MKVKKTIYLLLCLMLFSCPAESVMWERTYQITNDSGYDVVIRFYESFSNENFDETVVLNNQFYIGNKIEGSNFDALNDTESISPGQSYSSFTIIVVYNDEKKIEYSLVDTDGDGISDSFSEPTSRNLIRSGNYTHIGNDIYEYVLTEEDYNNATPCNGDCLD